MKRDLTTKEKLSLIIDLANVLDIIIADELGDNFDGLELELMHQLARLCKTIDYKEISNLENNSTQS